MERRDWPVFVIGCHRSGSTLLRYILDSHPRLVCPPESKFISALEAFYTYPQNVKALRTLEVSQAQLWGQLRGMVDSVLVPYAQRRGKARWVDKTPNYYRLLPFIDRIFQAEVLFVFIVRHPFDSVCSLEGVGAFTTAQPEDPEIAAAVARWGYGRVAWARYWCEVNERIDDFRTCFPDRALSCSYESLAGEPVRTVSDVLRFLGEDDCADTMIADAFRGSHANGYQDWKIRSTTYVHQSSVGLWSDWRDRDIRRLWRIVAPVATRFGYSEPRQVTRLEHGLIRRLREGTRRWTGLCSE